MKDTSNEQDIDLNGELDDSNKKDLNLYVTITDPDAVGKIIEGILEEEFETGYVLYSSCNVGKEGLKCKIVLTTTEWTIANAAEEIDFEGVDLKLTEEIRG